MTSTSTIDLPAMTEHVAELDADTGELIVSISGTISATNSEARAEFVAEMAEDIDTLVVCHMRALQADLQRLLNDAT